MEISPKFISQNFPKLKFPLHFHETRRFLYCSKFKVTLNREQILITKITNTECIDCQLLPHKTAHLFMTIYSLIPCIFRAHGKNSPTWNFLVLDDVTKPVIFQTYWKFLKLRDLEFDSTLGARGAVTFPEGKPAFFSGN